MMNLTDYLEEFGTVISGTLRPQDLIPAFLDALHDVAPEYTLENPIPQCALEDDEDAFWRETFWFTMEELEDVLNEHVPEGYYFGAHPGDGADFGYWPIED